MKRPVHVERELTLTTPKARDLRRKNLCEHKPWADSCPGREIVEDEVGRSLGNGVKVS
jgi:hypothetical protein